MKTLALIVPFFAVLAFCGVCVLVVTVLAVSALGDWIRLRRNDRESRELWRWQFAHGLTAKSFDEWRKQP